MPFLRSDLSSIDLGGAEIVAYDHDAARAAVITGGSTLAVVSYKKGFDKPKLLESFELPGDAQSTQHARYFVGLRQQSPGHQGHAEHHQKAHPPRGA
jgi:hypothetical protein